MVKTALANTTFGITTMIATNNYAERAVAVGGQFAKANHESNPLYRMFEGLGPVAEA
jgi:hypothetical protein